MSELKPIDRIRIKTHTEVAFATAIRLDDGDEWGLGTNVPDQDDAPLLFGTIEAAREDNEQWGEETKRAIVRVRLTVEEIVE